MKENQNFRERLRHLVRCVAATESSGHDSEYFRAIFASALDSTPLLDSRSVHDESPQRSVTEDCVLRALYKLPKFLPYNLRVRILGWSRASVVLTCQGENDVSFEKRGLRHSFVALRRILLLNAHARSTGSFRSGRPRYFSGMFPL